MYDISSSRIKRKSVQTNDIYSAKNEEKQYKKGKVLLFATRTCPNCKIADTMLQEAEISYEKVYAEENADLANEYGIKQAPTLVVVNSDKVEKYSNASNIRTYIEKLS